MTPTPQQTKKAKTTSKAKNKTTKGNIKKKPVDKVTNIKKLPTKGSKKSAVAHKVKVSNDDYMGLKQSEYFRQILIAWKMELMKEVDKTVHHMQIDASNFPDPNDRATQEEGFALVVAMMLLFVMTVMGTTLVINASSQSKVVAVSESEHQTFLSAETGIQDAISWLSKEVGKGNYPKNKSTIIQQNTIK